MFNPYSFKNRVLQVGFSFILESQNINLATSKIIIKPNYPEFGNEVGYMNDFKKELTVIYARLIN